MDKAYYLLGFGLFWGGGLFLFVALLLLAWQHRPRNHLTSELSDLWQWVVVRLLRKDFNMPIEGARILFSIDRSHQWPTWKRNLLATSIRRAKRNGFKDPYA